MLREEWPGWMGPDLPEPLRLLCPSGGRFKGDAVVAYLEPPRSSFSSLFLRRRAPADRLSEREAEVALAYSMGMEAGEIASSMGVSVASVRNRIQQAYAALGVSSRVALVGALAVLERERKG
jgi:DNA-binding NarL/FixJ family response regulator